MAEAKPDHHNQSEDKQTSGNDSEGNHSEKNISKQLPLPNIEGLKILGLLGQGGMAVVYKAEHLSLRRIVAVKMLPTSALGESGIKRFQSEAKKLANLDHPNIVRVYSCGISKDGVPYIEMELLDGRTLSHYLSSKELSTEQLGNILIDVLKALQYAHDAGLVHRDIKPANIIVQKENDVYSGMLLDFGIATSLTHSQQRLTQSGDLIGTPAYMSPEQCKGEELSERSDLYSIGCILYECFMGKAPFAGDNPLERMYKHINEAVPDLISMKANCGEELAALIHKSLAKEPQERQASATLMQAELEEALHTIPSPHEVTQDDGKTQTHKFIIAMTASLLLIITIAGFVAQMPPFNGFSPKKTANLNSKFKNEEVVSLEKAIEKIEQGLNYRYTDPGAAREYLAKAIDLAPISALPRDKRLCSQEAWFCHALSASIHDEFGRINHALNDSDPPSRLEQSDSEWKFALKFARIFWEQHSSLQYGLSFLGYIRALNDEGRTSEAEKLCNKEIELQKANQPRSRALPLMQRGLCDVYARKGENTLAIKELSKLLEMNEQIPCTENEKFSNLLLLAKLSQPDERKAILDQTLNLHPTLKPMENTVNESVEDICRLDPGWSATLVKLFFPSWDEKEMKSIYQYNMALTFQQLGEKAKAKQAIQSMKDANIDANLKRCCDPDYDRQKVAEIENL